MINQNMVEEIKKLIKNGFDLKLISFELDIPLEDVKKCKLQLDRENLLKNSNITPIKIRQIKEKYKKLFYGENNETKVVNKKVYSQEDIMFVDSVYENIQVLIQNIENLSKMEIERLKVNIINELKKLNDKEFTIEQAENLYCLLNSQKLNFLYSYLKIFKISVERKLADSIWEVASNTEDIEKLEQLYREINNVITKEYSISIEGIKIKISSKIANLSQENAIDKMKNNYSEEIEKITEELANGTINISEAKNIINKEAIKRVNNSKILVSKSDFAVDKQKKQIIIQIKSLLKEKSEKYKIVNPELTVKNLQELCGEEIDSLIKSVIENLIKNREFDTAKELCDICVSPKDRKNPLFEFISFQKKEIVNAEIADFILKGINMPETVENIEYFELIEIGLKRKNINPSAIYLGTSRDGKRKITLADIWFDERQR